MLWPGGFREQLSLVGSALHAYPKEMHVEGVQEILSRAGIFQGVDAGAVDNLIKDMETVRFPRGTTIFEEGEPGDRLYIITSGKVKLARHAPEDRKSVV